MLADLRRTGRPERRCILDTQKRWVGESLAFLTPKEVSQVLRVSVYTVRRWIKEGSLPAYRVGRGWRISEMAMHEWLSRNHTAAVSNR